MRPTGAPSPEARGTVLVVEDEALVRRLVDRALTGAGFRTIIGESVEQGKRLLAEHASEIDLLLTDLRLDDGSGMDMIQAARAEAPEVVIVMMTALGTVSNAVAAMRAGAYDFLVKPFDPPEALLRTVERALERKRLAERNRFLERKVAESDRFRGLRGESAPMRRLMTMIEAVAPADSTVLVTGESGTGKELVARAIHERSSRSGKAFIAVNCGALAESVLESELFGHARGAFTGAVAARKGLFEEASGGTIFLDEVGETPLPIQVRLLRVLEQREIRPVGSNETRTIDVRVIAATNRDLVGAVRAGTFREDLYYRLNVVSVETPPLRDRPSDVPLLAHHFVERYAEKMKKTIKRIDPDALEILTSHSWPGNVRELQNAIERAVLLARDETIAVDALPPVLARGMNVGTIRKPYTLPLAAAIAAFERSYVENVLREAKGNVAEAARAAGVDRSNFRRVMKRFEIAGTDFGKGGGDGSE